MCLDSSANETKTTRHFIIDEAHYSSVTSKAPYAKDLVKAPINSKSTPSAPRITPQTTALAAAFNSAHTEVLSNSLCLTTAACSEKISHHIKLRGDRPTLGLKLAQADNGDIIVQDILPRTPAYRLPRWRTMLRGATLHSINNAKVKSTSDYKNFISTYRQLNHSTAHFTFIKCERVNEHADTTMPQLTFDQLSIINHHINSTKYDTEPWSDTHDSPKIHLDEARDILNVLHSTDKLTRRKSMLQSDWPD